MPTPTAARFDFRFETRYARAGMPFGVTPRTTGVTVDGNTLRVRFGPWRIQITAHNVRSASLTGPFGFLRTAGPAHLSLADRGLTFATNSQRGLCLQFHESIAGIDPLGVIRHPGLTLTVTDPEGLAAALGVTPTIS